MTMEENPQADKILGKEDFDKVCRCCLSESTVGSIFELKYEDTLFSDILCNLLCTKINSDDQLPKNVCDVCIGEVILFYNFKKKYDMSEIILLAIIEGNGKLLCEAETKSENIVEESVEDSDSFQIYQLAEEDLQNENKEIEISDNPFIPEIHDVKTNLLQENYLSDKECFKFDIEQEKETISDLGEKTKVNIKESENSSSRLVLPKVITCTCLKVFQTQSEYLLHRKKEKHRHARKFPCEICHKYFNRYGLQQHMRVHTKEKPYQCKTCSVRFSCRGNLLRHNMIHTGEKPHVCEFCGKGFIQGPTLEAHRRTHTGEKPYLCSYCGKRFGNQIVYNTHIHTHKRDKMKSPKGKCKNKDKSKEERYYQCEICLKSFKSKVVLRTHAMTHGEKRFLCSDCGKSFYTKMSLTAHYKNQHTDAKALKPLIPCTYCQRKFKNQLAYNFHIEKDHGEGKTDNTYDGSGYQCEFCHKFYSSKQVLNNHLLLHGERKFLCSECGKGFFSKKALDQHNLIHTGERPYSCDFCNKTFVQQGALKTHTYIHTGERPYVCRICSKAFTQGPHLKTHLRTHSGERPYTCSYCNKSFSHSGTLTVHVRTHTGETPYMCDQCPKGFYHSSSLKKHKKSHLDSKFEVEIKEEP